MEHLIEEIFFLQDKIFLRGFVFGLVHVGIMLIGFYTGWSINRLLKIISSGFIAGIIGVVIAHVIADYIAATLDPDIRSAALGIVVGGLLPLILIPFLEKYVTKSKYHIAIVGSGPAGLSAAARAAYHDQQAGRAEPVFRIRALLMSGNNPKAAVCCRLV